MVNTDATQNPDEVACSGGVNETNQKAETLRAMFKHYADVGLDHQRQSATTSNILLAIAGAILTLIGIDGRLDHVGDAMGAACVAIIGGFGMIWSWKQHETYGYWTNIADIYQKQLFDLVQVPESLQVCKLKKKANIKSAKEYGTVAVNRLRIRYLWVVLHGMVMALGIALAVGILCFVEAYPMAVVLGSFLFVLMVVIVIVVVYFRRPSDKDQERCE